MQYTNRYESPLGQITLAADETGLTGLWFAGQKYYALHLDRKHEEKDLPVFAQAKKWLDLYFVGKEPDFWPPLHLIGSAFQREVWELLCQIPYGQTTTYGALAKRLAEKRELPGMSAQAVGGAVAHNPISVIVPCHRVVGADGKLTGYAGGLDKKTALLRLEQK
ncbi:MAG: methylated-DNA--[protein]-cysteine S-methyltransferase [Bacteroidales bacterium]|nr:methylated-DNA--[protein]-cysteine S-methyltransferase [Bacteroidales bacterium]MCM1416719.1 methylated-DNA--[protein]-cysteine S-methyltransferase [bacterium]MCM1424112.1 methylated-DNA--[protein]-cysteine S-methyltransferase [bacterium]